MHLTDRDFGGFLPYIISSLGALKITVFSVSMDAKSSVESLNISETNPQIFPFIGIHPWSAQDCDLDIFEKLIDKSKSRRVGIGEIGLDRKYCDTEEKYLRQKSVFSTLLSWAETKQKPISVHSRDSIDDVLQILSSYKVPGVLLHWFSGDSHQLGRAIDQGYYVSFGPSLVYSNRIRQLAGVASPDHVLTESDGPVRYRGCFEGKAGVPLFIASVTYSLGQALGKPYHEMNEIVFNNSQRYIGEKLH